MKKTFLLTIAFFLILSTFGQNPKNAKSLNSKPIIEKGVELHDEGEYEKAVQQFKRVPIGDTLYALAQYEMALTYFHQELYDKSIETLEYLVENPSPFVRSSTIYTLLGTVYLNTNKEEKAISILDKAIFLSPYSFRLHITQGDAYMKLNKFEQAEQCYKKAILCTPISQLGHASLGKVYIKQHRIIPAIMALNYAVFINPKSNMAIEILQLIDALLVEISEKVDSEMDPNLISEAIRLENERFNELEILVSSNIALSKKFKDKSKINHIIVSQSQLVFENLPEPLDSKEIIDYLYIPFFKGIMENEFFNLYTYHILSGTNIDNNEVEKKAKKMSKKIAKVTDYATVLLKEKAKFGIGEENNNTPKNEYEYNNENGNLEAIGGYSKKSGSGKVIYSGDWIIINSNGAISTYVSLKNDKKDGISKFFHNGYKIQKIPFELDSINGIAYVYFPTEVNESEKIKMEVPFINNKMSGIRKEFNRAGILIEEEEYKDNFYHGVVKGFSNHGFLIKQEVYENGENRGLHQQFYPNGQVSFEVFYAKEDEEGYLKSFYPDGKIKKEGVVINEQLNGTLKSYYPNGKMMSVGSYNNNGNEDGFWTDYFENGNVSLEYGYNNGELNGEMKFYLRNGFLYGTCVYKNGKLLEVITYLPNKEIRETIKAKNNIFTVNYYNDLGQLMITSLLNEEGLKEGIITFYYPNGAVYSKIPYKNGVLKGEKRIFYLNGDLKEYCNYNKNEVDGLYIDYYENDSIKSEGYYQNGSPVGSWFGYNIDGTLSSQMIYDDNNLISYIVTYFPNGDKKKESFYKFGLLSKIVIYNNKNEVLKVDHFTDGEGMYRNYYLNGALQSEGRIRHNEYIDTLYYYDLNGKVTSFNTYLDGKLHGRNYFFTDEKPLEYSDITFVHGEIHGLSNMYKENGVLIHQYNYEYGAYSGEGKSFFDNGKLARTHIHEKNMREDVSVYYAIDGKTVTYKLKYIEDEIIAYAFINKNNKLTDFIPISKDTQEIVAYYPNGQKSIEFKFVNGERSGVELLYYPNGKIYRKGNYHLNQYHGEYIKYYSNGNVQMKENNYYDMSHGGYYEYYENGTPKMEGNYYYDQPHGSFKYYDKNGVLTKEIEFYYGSIINQK